MQGEQIEALLSSLPKLKIERLPAGTSIPRMPSVKPLISYNGFDGFERMRTWEVTKWLMDLGAMPRPEPCGLCGGGADQYHAENYFDLSTYQAVCRSCHARIHGRLQSFATWQRGLPEFGLPVDHWVYRLSDGELPVRDWYTRRGGQEPTFADFVEA